ncbi:sensor histidine kinase [Streptomyces sp. F63]|uniref:ATP-binding protein n=1 Tax=Streptomyces sp. F63 TaxID=2824887 RepID=UPI001B3772EF|nr:ATP-binding protein [Streptomyces sp. F63]MBQ0984754.1 sensor histidine kinase [Streptomyces sp. F63]
MVRPSIASSTFRRRFVRPVAMLLAAVAVTDPWALGGVGAGWAVACHVLTAALLVALFERLQSTLRSCERETLAAREEAARHDAEWREFCARQDARGEETVRHLADVRLPAALAGEPVPAAHPAENHPGTAREYDRVLAAAAAAVRTVREREESLRLVVVALARRVQASSHRIQEEMAALEARHSAHPDVLEASMRGDHAAAQQARIAQSLAVLCGEWPGQQWQKPHALVDVVRAGASRIVSYQRVRVSGDQDIAAVASVVEPLVHVVAELLANATQCAPPTTHVEVTVRTVTRGAVIEIDDAGLGMDEYALEQAREIAAGRRLLGFADLGEIPQTGLAVVGRYAERHRLKVDLLPSPYGGVRAVVLVPGTLLQTLEPPAVPASRRPSAGETAHAGAVPAGAAAMTGAVPVPPSAAAGGGAGLPQRRSSRHRAAVPPLSELTGTAKLPPPPPPPSPERAGAWMGALFAGSRAGAARTPAPDGAEAPGEGAEAGEATETAGPGGPGPERSAAVPGGPWQRVGARGTGAAPGLPGRDGGPGGDTHPHRDDDDAEGQK